MSYIDLLNAFERWCETNYLPSLSQLIWYKLIALFNRCAWAEWVTIDNQRLMVLTGMKNEKTFILYRDKLLESNLFFYEKGKKSCPNRYKINTVIFTAFTTVKDTVNSTVKEEVKDTVEPTDINRQEKEQTNLYNLLLNKYTSLMPSKKMYFGEAIHFNTQIVNDEQYNNLSQEYQMKLINEFWRINNEK